VADDLIGMSGWDCAILVERSPLLLKRRSIENRSTNEATNVRRSIIAGVIFKSAPIAPTVSSCHAECEKCLIKMNGIGHLTRLSDGAVSTCICHAPENVWRDGPIHSKRNIRRGQTLLKRVTDES
jgi:hypothetical protein